MNHVSVFTWCYTTIMQVEARKAGLSANLSLSPIGLMTFYKHWIGLGQVYKSNKQTHEKYHIMPMSQ